jgi:glycosyltransferase involved in cell wall biosynthesis
MNSKPRVSVIVPNYNYAHFLRRRLQTILDQTYTDYEIIYLDDCSTDNSAEVVAEFAHDPRIRCLANTTNSGSPFIQINKGVRLAAGEYIWVAEADDFADRHFLETLVPLLAQNANVGVAYCQSIAIDEHENVLFSMEKHTDYLDCQRWKHDFIANGKRECRNYLLYSNTIPNFSAVLFRRSVFEQAGYAEESLRLCGDWLTWVKMLMISDVAFVAKPLNYYRWHTGSVRKTLNYISNVHERYYLYSYLHAKNNISDREFDIVYSKLMKEWTDRISRSKWRDSLWDIPAVFKIAWQGDPRFLPRFCWHAADKMSFGIARKLRRRLGIEILAKRPAGTSSGT